MKPILFVLATLVLCGHVVAANVTPHTLLAHADEQQYWIARVEHLGTTDYTYLDSRQILQDDRWQRLCRFETAVEGIAGQGSAAGVLLHGGSWAIVYADGNVVSGGPLPAGARMVALGAVAHTWWAVGETPGGLKAALAATRPATRPGLSATGPTTNIARTAPSAAVASTAPASEPAASKAAMVLYELFSDWVPVAELPGGGVDRAHVALEVIDQVAYVAIYDGGKLWVYHLDHGKSVADLKGESFPQIAAFKLLAGGGVPRVWVQQQTGADVLIPLRAGGAKLTLSVPSDAAAKDRDVAVFGKSIRAVSRVGAKVVEQRYAADSLKPEDKPTELPLAEATQLIDLQGLHTLVAIVSLMLVLFGWFRQQAASEGIGPKLDNVVIAPVGRRFVAGLIDAFPVIFTMAWFYARHASLPASVPQSRQFLFFVFYWSSGLFYVLHTTLIETYAGRSLGKIMLGVRVVTMQGGTPEPGALVMRNALRVFDLSLFFFPVVFIPFAPLRQRSGDLVAGTVVVLDKAREQDSASDDKNAS